MSLRLRFLLSLLVVMLVVAGPALFAISRVSMLRDLVLDLRGQAAQSALAVTRVEAGLLQTDRYQRVYAATADPGAAALMHAGMAEAEAALGTLRAAGYSELAGDASRAVARVAASSARLQLLVEQDLLEDATTHLLTDATPQLDAARATVPVLAAAIDLHTDARVPVAQRSARLAATATTIALLVGFALALALALAASRVLTRPLDRLRGAMSRVADGTFETPADLPYDRTDEVGDLSRSFRTMTGRLAELDRLKADFVNTVSHDLKTPISVIVGYAELIREDLADSLDARQHDMVRELAEQARTLQQRVDRLHEISRMEAGRLGLALEAVDLRHFAAEICREHEPAARKRGIRILLSIDDATPAFITADPDVLRTDVIGNLMRNALAFTPVDGTIRISIRPDGPRVSIEIEDSGRGIAADQLHRIFEKYYESRGEARRVGLGLAIAKAGTENHGGRIEAHSRAGSGAQFRVTLPAPAGVQFNRQLSGRGYHPAPGRRTAGVTAGDGPALPGENT